MLPDTVRHAAVMLAAGIGIPVLAALIDHFGLMAARPLPITRTRAAGIALMAAGVLLTQKARGASGRQCGRPSSVPGSGGSAPASSAGIA